MCHIHSITKPQLYSSVWWFIVEKFLEQTKYICSLNSNTFSGYWYIYLSSFSAIFQTYRQGRNMTFWGPPQTEPSSNSPTPVLKLFTCDIF